MNQAVNFEPGNYRYIPGVFQYSAGVAALPGYKIVRVTLNKPVALTQGFDLIRRFLQARQLEPTAFCACELRSPAQFTERAFDEFNRLYVNTLTDWGIFRDGVNPVARSNVCPALSPPAQPSLYAFSFVTADTDAPPTAVIAGSGEVPEGQGNYRDHIVAPGDVSTEGMGQKAAYVVGEMQRRLACLGFGSEQVTGAQVYTVQAFDALMPTQLLPSGLFDKGVIWHYCRPPIVGLEFEMDVRVVQLERAADAR